MRVKGQKDPQAAAPARWGGVCRAAVSPASVLSGSHPACCWCVLSPGGRNGAHFGAHFGAQGNTFDFGTEQVMFPASVSSPLGSPSPAKETPSRSRRQQLQSD